MFLAFLLIILAPPAPLQISFDAEKPGTVSTSIEDSPASPSWIISSDPDNAVSKHYLSIKPELALGQQIECFFKDIALQDINFSARVFVAPAAAKPLEGTPRDESGIILRSAGSRSCRISFCTADNTVKLLSTDSDENQVLASADLPKTNTPAWFAVNISLSSKRVTCEVDGKQLLNYTELPTTTYGKIGLYSNNRAVFKIDDILIANTAPVLTQSLIVRGMTCSLCEAKIENALKALKGVKDAKANHVDGTCIVTLDENAPCDVKDLVKTVEELHYQVHIEGA